MLYILLFVRLLGLWFDLNDVYVMICLFCVVMRSLSVVGSGLVMLCF